MKNKSWSFKWQRNNNGKNQQFGNMVHSMTISDTSSKCCLYSSCFTPYNYSGFCTYNKFGREECQFIEYSIVIWNNCFKFACLGKFNFDIICLGLWMNVSFLFMKHHHAVQVQILMDQNIFMVLLSSVDIFLNCISFFFNNTHYI